MEYYWKFCGTVTQTCGESGESGVDSGAELVLCESGTADPCGGTQSYRYTILSVHNPLALHNPSALHKFITALILCNWYYTILHNITQFDTGSESCVMYPMKTVIVYT